MLSWSGAKACGTRTALPQAFVGISVGTGTVWGHFWGHEEQVCRLTLAAQLLSSLKNCFEPFPVNQVQQLLRRPARSLVADLPLTHR